MSDDLIYFNGVNGATGDYLMKPRGLADVAALARSEQPRSAEEANWLRRIGQALRRPFLALPFDIPPEDVARAGWAVVFAPGTPNEVSRALEPLLTRRKKGVAPDRYKVLDYRPGEGASEWLRRQGAAPGSISPTKVPYYVLLVGGPEAIPFEFQYLLDIEYAVGRLAFDSPGEYEQYARSVIDYEAAAAAPNVREIAYWATRHSSQDATRMSADWLATPLFQGVPAAGGEPGERPLAEVQSFRSRLLKGDEATKGSLAELLHPPAPKSGPALLFTASHGLGWPRGHERQAAAQGALLCQDYPGFGVAPQPPHYLAAGDVADDARVHGLVAFLFACFGAGTPRFNNFLYEGDQDLNFLFDRGQRPERIAEQAFVSPLPRRLLSHPQGGALAVIGHIERAWGYSIRPLDEHFEPVANVGPQLAPFRNCLGRILGGLPVGHATKDISDKYAILAAELLSRLDPGQAGPRPGDAELAWTWVERNDAQNYVLLGDPAVRLRTELLK